MSCCCSFKLHFHHSIRFHFVRLKHEKLFRLQILFTKWWECHYLTRISSMWKWPFFANVIRELWSLMCHWCGNKNANCAPHLIFVTFRPHTLCKKDDNSDRKNRHPTSRTEQREDWALSIHVLPSHRFDPQVSSFCVKKSARISHWVQWCVIATPVRPMSLSTAKYTCTSTEHCMHCTEHVIETRWKKIPADRAQQSQRNCVINQLPIVYAVDTGSVSSLLVCLKWNL